MTKNILIFTILLLSFSQNTFAKTVDEVDGRVNILRDRISTLSGSIAKDYVTKEVLHQEFKDAINLSTSISSSGAEKVANLISSQNTILTWVSILFAIFGVFFIKYITHLKNTVIKSEKEVKNLKLEIDKFLSDKTNQLEINFWKTVMRRLIERLEFEPDNIPHLFGLLTTFNILELGEDYYFKLRNCYLISKNAHKDDYKTILFQHFIGYVMKDEIFSDFEENLSTDFRQISGWKSISISFLSNERIIILENSLKAYLEDKTVYEHKFKKILSYFKRKKQLENHKELFLPYIDNDSLIAEFFKEEVKVQEQKTTESNKN